MINYSFGNEAGNDYSLLTNFITLLFSFGGGTSPAVPKTFSLFCVQESPGNAYGIIRIICDIEDLTRISHGQGSGKPQYYLSGLFLIYYIAHYIYKMLLNMFPFGHDYMRYSDIPVEEIVIGPHHFLMC